MKEGDSMPDRKEGDEESTRVEFSRALTRTMIIDDVIKKKHFPSRIR